MAHALRVAARALLIEAAHAAVARRSHRLVVLVYHRVLPQPRPADAWAVTTDAFRCHLDVLDALGFVDVALSELEASTSRPTGRRVLIAFDDGYETAFQHALPVLRAMRRRGAFFLIAGMLGGLSEWERAFGMEPSRLFGLDEARELIAHGMAVGSHSMTHVDLRRVDDLVLEREVTKSRSVLENGLGVAIKSFSVPFGRDDHRVGRYLRAAGYARKFSNPLMAGLRDGILSYPVFGVLATSTAAELRHALLGADEPIWMYHRLRLRLCAFLKMRR